MKLTADQYNKILLYIKTNANKFREEIDNFLFNSHMFYGIQYNYEDVEQLVNDYAMTLVKEAIMLKTDLCIDNIELNTENNKDILGFVNYAVNMIDYTEEDFEKLISDINEIQSRGDDLIESCF